MGVPDRSPDSPGTDHSVCGDRLFADWIRSLLSSLSMTFCCFLSPVGDGQLEKHEFTASSHSTPVRGIMYQNTCNAYIYKKMLAPKYTSVFQMSLLSHAPGPVARHRADAVQKRELSDQLLTISRQVRKADRERLRDGERIRERRERYVEACVLVGDAARQ